MPDDTSVLQRIAVFNKIFDSARVYHVLLREYAGSQRILSVALQHGDRCLFDDGAVIQLGSDEVHRGTMKFHSGFQCTLVGIKTWEAGQKRRMNIQQPAMVVRSESRCEYAQKPGKHHQVG